LETVVVKFGLMTGCVALLVVTAPAGFSEGDVM
jgi:hypothetical protein